MAIGLRAAQGSNNGSGGTSLTMSLPAGVTDGDVLVMSVTARGGSDTTISTPTSSPWVDRTWPNDSGDRVMSIASNGAGLWVAVGYLYSTSVPSIAKSTDGINWTSVTPPWTSGGSMLTVAYGNGVWVVGGYNSGLGLATSPDGDDWTNNTDSGMGADTVYDLRYADGVWVAVTGGTTKLWTTTDPTGAWTGRYSGSATPNKVAYGNGVWVGACSGARFLTASDPEGTWTLHSNVEPWWTASSPIYAVAYHAGLWVAAGASGLIGTTTDPVNGSWTQRTNPNGSGDAKTVAWGGGIWLITWTGESPSNVIFSWDGLTWYSSPGPTETQFSAAFASGLWVLGGDGTFRTTTDPTSQWRLLGSKIDSGTTLCQAIYHKVAASEPSSYAVTITSAKATGIIIALSGASPTEPAAARYGGQANASSTTITAPSLTLGASYVGIEVVLSGIAYGTTIDPVTLTEPANGEATGSGGGANSRTTSEVEYGSYSGSGPASRTATAGNAAVNIGHHVFIEEAAPPVTNVYPDTVTGTGAALDATAIAGTAAVAGLAEATGAAPGPAGAVGVGAAPASGTGAAYGPTGWNGVARPSVQVIIIA